MGLDKAGCNFEIGLDEAAVNLDGGAARASDAQIDVIGIVARKMIFDLDRGKHPRIANEFEQFISFVGTMKTRGDEDTDAILRDARFEHIFDHRPEKKMIRNRPRDVANEYAGAASSARKGFQGLRSNGTIKRLPDGCAGVGKLRHGVLANDRGAGVGGQMHGQVASAKRNLDGPGIHVSQISIVLPASMREEKFFVSACAPLV